MDGQGVERRYPLAQSGMTCSQYGEILTSTSVLLHSNPLFLLKGYCSEHQIPVTWWLTRFVVQERHSLLHIVRTFGGSVEIHRQKQLIFVPND